MIPWLSLYLHANWTRAISSANEWHGSWVLVLTGFCEDSCVCCGLPSDSVDVGRESTGKHGDAACIGVTVLIREASCKYFSFISSEDRSFYSVSVSQLANLPWDNITNFLNPATKLEGSGARTLDGKLGRSGSSWKCSRRKIFRNK